jgi:hypothetical protein
MTSQGRPDVIFRRALEAGNLVVAELAPHQLRGLSLADALELTALAALRDRERGARYAVRWLARWLEEAQPTLDQAVLVVGALRALGGPGHASAVAALRVESGSATGRQSTQPARQVADHSRRKAPGPR